MVKRPSIVESYDHYYGSGLYDARYPGPNPPTYRAALRLARTSPRILDFGAGSGRYTLPVLHSTNAFVCAYDISVDACKALKGRATAAGIGSQRLLVTSDLDAARAAGPYDLVISLFGVLSHIEGTENRINILNSIRSQLTPEGLLLLTVPHALRRFPLHVSPDGHNSESRGVFSLRTYMRRYYPSARPVTYHHHLKNAERPFPYYLFSRRGLTRAKALPAAGYGRCCGWYTFRGARRADGTRVHLLGVAEHGGRLLDHLEVRRQAQRDQPLHRTPAAPPPGLYRGHLRCPPHRAGEPELAGLSEDWPYIAVVKATCRLLSFPG